VITGIRQEFHTLCARQDGVGDEKLEGVATEPLDARRTVRLRLAVESTLQQLLSDQPARPGLTFNGEDP